MYKNLILSLALLGSTAHAAEQKLDMSQAYQDLQSYTQEHLNEDPSISERVSRILEQQGAIAIPFIEQVKNKKILVSMNTRTKFEQCFPNLNNENKEILKSQIRESLHFLGEYYADTHGKSLSLHPADSIELCSKKELGHSMDYQNGRLILGLKMKRGKYQLVKSKDIREGWNNANFTMEPGLKKTVGKFFSSKDELWNLVNPLGTFRTTIRRVLAKYKQGQFSFLSDMTNKLNTGADKDTIKGRLANYVIEQSKGMADKERKNLLEFISDLKSEDDVRHFLDNWNYSIYNSSTHNAEETEYQSRICNQAQIQSSVKRVGIYLSAISVRNMHNILSKVDLSRCDKSAEAEAQTSNFEWKDFVIQIGLITTDTGDQVVSQLDVSLSPKTRMSWFNKAKDKTTLLK